MCPRSPVWAVTKKHSAGVQNSGVGRLFDMNIFPDTCEGKSKLKKGKVYIFMLKKKKEKQLTSYKTTYTFFLQACMFQKEYKDPERIIKIVLCGG